MANADEARDTVDLIFERAPPHERVVNICDAAIGTIMGRLCYTRGEAMQAMRAYCGLPAPRSRPKTKRASEEARA